LQKSGDEISAESRKAFELRRKSGRLPTPIDADHSVAQLPTEIMLPPDLRAVIATMAKIYEHQYHPLTPLR